MKFVCWVPGVGEVCSEVESKGVSDIPVPDSYRPRSVTCKDKKVL